MPHTDVDADSNGDPLTELDAVLLLDTLALALTDAVKRDETEAL